ncbi:KR domain-containing protein [Bisporella sp. PMI_857]|nr:KR domain-containing protein [Bisporella sp. PMI_857]
MHELLGSKRLESSSTEYSWRNVLQVPEVPWLAERIFFNQMLFPASAYISMAGEALRQISNKKLDSYELRNFKVTSALILTSDAKVELQTTLRLVENAGQTSIWYQLRIASYDKDHWVERCVGIVSSLMQQKFEDSDVPSLKDSLPRHITRSYWYDVVADIGLRYGPAFQSLDDISTGITDPRAVATISSIEDTAKYILHPIAIDQCFQILMVAAHQGQGRKIKELCVPTFIEHFVVSGEGRDGRSKLKIGGKATKSHLGVLTGSVSLVSESGHPILSMQGCKLSAVPIATSRGKSKLFSFTEWDTDASLCNLNQGLTPFHSELDPSILLERLTLLYALNVGGLGVSQGYVPRILDKIASRKQGRFGLISDISTFIKLDITTRNAVIGLLKAQIAGTELASLGALVGQIFTSDKSFSKDIAARTKALNQCHPLARNGGLLARPIKLLAHKNPRLRILELGNGGDETTCSVLTALKSRYGEKMYITYSYAATSPEAVKRAKKLFGGTSNINVVYFDLQDQGQNPTLAAGYYDLIITTDFLIPGRDLRIRVNHLKNLLKPLGHLIAIEALPEPEWALLVKDYLSDSSSAEISKNDTSIRHVNVALLQSEFEFGNEEEGLSTNLRVVAGLKKPLKYANKVTLAVPSHGHSLVRAVQTAFLNSGISYDTCTLEDDFPQGQDVISLVDFDEPYLYNITAAKFRGFADRMSNFKGSMIWVTPMCQISCKNPNSSMILGLTRTLRAELRKDITIVEIDNQTTTDIIASKAILRIYQELNHRPKAKDVDPDYEYAVIDGDIKIPRIHWTTGEEELSHCAKKSLENQDRSRNLTLSGPSMPASFRSDACYLLVGGLGGLGRSISTWMVENGARNILFLSRSAKEGPETTPFFDELRSQGCLVSVFAGSVNSLSDVEAAVKQAPRPLAGVMQVSAVMRDNWMSQMTFSEWEQCVQPKVLGTWNLHKATFSSKLDFFLLFSSICGVTGQWGQANYNAANTFLDAFVNYRHGLNLPASVVDIGFMGGVGMAMENSALVEKLKASGYYFLSEQDLIDALTIAISNSYPGNDRFLNKSQLGLGIRPTKALSNPSTRVVWKKDARMLLSHQLGGVGEATDEEAREYFMMAYQDQKHSE